MSLQTLKRSNSLDKLLNAVKEESAPQEKKSYKDEELVTFNWLMRKLPLEQEFVLQLYKEDTD